MFKVISPNGLLLVSVCYNMHVFEKWFQNCSSSTLRPVICTDHQDMTKPHLHACASRKLIIDFGVLTFVLNGRNCHRVCVKVEYFDE